MNKSIKTLFLLMFISLAIALFWDKIPLISQTVHLVFNPTIGKILNFNAIFGLILVSAAISFFITLIQKYTTDQETLRSIKKEQKLLQEEMKAYKDHPEKLLALQKKQLEFIPRTFEITLRPLMYTSIPIIIFFRWFSDYFTANPFKIFGLMHWLLAYLIFSIVFTTIFRKVLNVA